MIIVFALFGLPSDSHYRKELVAVFRTNAGAIRYAETHKVPSWHIEEINLLD